MRPGLLRLKHFLYPELLRNSNSIAIFKSRLLSFIRPIQSDVYNIFDPIGLKFLTRLRLDFSHLNEHRFRHNFQDCLNPSCSCSLQTEDTIHCLLHCHQSSNTVSILSIVWNLFLKVLILCLKLPKKIYSYIETHVLI